MRRNRLKAALIYTSMSVAICAIFLITAISHGIISMYSSMLKTDGDIIVTQRGIADTFFSDVDSGLVDEIARIDGVRAASAVIVGASPLDDIPIVGVYGVSQNRMTVYRLLRGEYPEAGEVMLGTTIAEVLEQPEHVEISSAPFEVSGVYRSGIGFEDGGVVMPLADAGAMFHKSASFLLISAHVGAEADTLVERIAAVDDGIEVKTTDSFVDGYNQFRIISTSATAVSSIAFLMGLLGIASMMSMVVNDRQAEFGIMRAIGISKRSIAGRLIVEALLITAGSFLTAWLISEGILYALKNLEQLRGYINGTIDAGVMVSVLLSATAMAIAGSLLPAFLASRVDPVTLIQRGTR